MTRRRGQFGVDGGSSRSGCHEINVRRRGQPEKNESVPESPSSLRRGLAMLRACMAMHPRPFAVGIAGAAVFAGATVASSSVLSWVVDHVITARFRDGHLSRRTLLAGVGALVLVGAVRSVGVVFRRTFAGRASNAVAASLRAQVADQLATRPIGWFDDRPSGELIAHAGVDVDAVAEALGPLPLTSGVALLIAIAAIALLQADLVLGGVAVGLFPVLTVINVTYQRRLMAPMKDAQDAIGRMTGVVHESFDAAVVVKAFGVADGEQSRFVKQAEGLRDAKVRVVFLRALFDAAVGAIPNLAGIVLLVVGAYRVRSGAVTLGGLSGVLYLFTLLVWPLRVVGYMLGDMTHGVAGWDRVQRMLASVDPIRVPPGIPAPGFAVRLKDVGFSYVADRPVLSGVDLEVPVGEIIALVGVTGSGKTTLLELLAGLRSPQCGIVEVVAGGGVLAFQEPFLFAGSLRDNIDLPGGRDASAIERALSLAQADEFVLDLAGRGDTVVGERGVTLSGGQRQRIALARAFSRSPELLLMDDATSSLDPTTEALVLKALPAALEGGTAIIVASRPSTISLADRVAFLESGRIVAVGTHDALMADVASYRHLVEAYERDRA